MWGNSLRVVGSKRIGIDLFAGAGGLSLGLSNAGFEMKLGVEIDRDCASTLQRNHNMTVINSDIMSIRPLDAIRHANIQQNELAIVAGGIHVGAFRYLIGKTVA